jgi:hypothetical protein
MDFYLDAAIQDYRDYILYLSQKHQQPQPQLSFTPLHLHNQFMLQCCSTQPISDPLPPSFVPLRSTFPPPCRRRELRDVPRPATLLDLPAPAWSGRHHHRPQPVSARRSKTPVGDLASTVRSHIHRSTDLPVNSSCGSTQRTTIPRSIYISSIQCDLDSLILTDAHRENLPSSTGSSLATHSHAPCRRSHGRDILPGGCTPRRDTGARRVFLSPVEHRPLDLLHGTGRHLFLLCVRIQDLL